MQIYKVIIDNKEIGIEQDIDGNFIIPEQYVQGRFPANILLSEEAAKMLDEQSGVSGGKYKAPNARPRKGFMIGNVKGSSNAPDNYGDKGGASRFFYVAKASKRERNLGLKEEQEPSNCPSGVAYNEYSGVHSEKKKGNFHPTVKPLKLMEYLVKLTSMPNPNQIYLDPFLGSGTTAMACKLLGKNWIGIEKEKEYVEIACARISNPYRIINYSQTKKEKFSSEKQKKLF